MKQLSIIVFLLLIKNLTSQNFEYPKLLPIGEKFQDFIPKGWKLLDTTFGDLNKDSLKDLALVIERVEKVSVKNDIDEEVLSNPRIIGIYFFDKTLKKYKLAEYSNSFILMHDNPNMEEPFEKVSIQKGVLKIKFSVFMNSGGWGMSNNLYIFRYQNNEFKLIGADNNSTTRNTGEISNLSYNFITKKVVIQTGIISDDKLKSKTRAFEVKEQKTFKTFKAPFSFEVEKDSFI